MENGNHIHEPKLTYFKVKALKLSPDPSQKGYLDVDGEKLPSYDTVSMEVHRGLANIILPISEL